jgi:hypothetical protein
VLYPIDHEPAVKTDLASATKPSPQIKKPELKELFACHLKKLSQYAG